MTNHGRVLRIWLMILLAAQLPAWSQNGLDEMFPWFSKPKHVPGFPDLGLSPDRLSQALDKDQVIPVDLRSAEAFQKGHIPGAVNLELAGGFDLAAARSALEDKGLCGAKAVVLYSDSSSLLPLGPAFLDFEAAGHPRTQLLLGGYSAWIASGGEVETQPSFHPPCVFETPAQSEAIVDRRWVADNFDRAGVEILDLRGPGGWESGSYEAPPLFSLGHIPHSLPLDITALLAKDGGWPTLATARALLGSLGPRPKTFVDLDGTFVLYGTGTDDPRPGVGYLLLRAMDVSVKVFAGGFQSWDEDETSPIVRITSTAELKNVLTADEKKETGEPVVFDLREDWDFREGHIPGAESLPSDRFAAELESRIGKRQQPIDRSKTPLVFYCYGRECIRSWKCATIAARHGYLNLLWYREEIDSWKREGGIVEGPSDSAKSRTTAQIYKSLENIREEPSPLHP